MRAELVRGGAVRAVLALPAGAAPPLHVGLQLWVLQRPEPGGPERKSVLFIDMAGSLGSGAGEQAAGSPRTGSFRAATDWAA
ncbi:hypothetical protein ACFQVA_33120 [Actinomadura keratinilytica]